MKEEGGRWVKGILLILLLGISGFDAYYFFIRREVGPAFYINKLFEKPKDPILSDPEYKDYVSEYKDLNEKYRGRKYAVLLGDSVIARFKADEYFEGRQLLNRGIYSDSTEGLMNRIEENCNNLNVSKCFILIGYNDLKYRSDETIIENIGAILQSVRADAVYTIGLLPVGQKYKGFMKRIPGLNERIKERARRHGSIYVDAYSKFVGPDGYMRKELSTDGVHPNKEGYKELKKAIEAWLGQ